MAEVGALKPLFERYGLKAWFYSDDHEPAHFMVKRGGQWAFKIHFLNDPEDMLERDPHSRLRDEISARDRRRITDATVEKRAEILGEWERIHKDD